MDQDAFHQGGRALAEEIRKGQAAGDAPLSQRVAAMLTLVEGWVDSFDPSQEAIDARISVARQDLRIRPPLRKLIDEGGLTAEEAHAVLVAAGEQCAPSDDGPRAAIIELGRSMAALSRGLPEGQRAQLLMVGIDYARRRYMARFHIAGADEAVASPFSTGDLLSDFENVSSILSKANFDDEPVSEWKRFMVFNALEGASAQCESAEERELVREAIIDGVTSKYRFQGIDPKFLDAERLAREISGNRVGLVESTRTASKAYGAPTATVFLREGSPYQNPLVAFFDAAVEKESGFSLFQAVEARMMIRSENPEARPDLAQRALDSWRSARQPGSGEAKVPRSPGQ